MNRTCVKATDPEDNERIRMMGDRIRKLREQNGIDRKNFAAKLELSVEQIGKIENGERACTVRNFYWISRHLGVSYKYLLDGETDEVAYDEIDDMLRVLDYGQVRRIKYAILGAYGDELKKKGKGI